MKETKPVQLEYPPQTTHLGRIFAVMMTLAIVHLILLSGICSVFSLKPKIVCMRIWQHTQNVTLMRLNVEKEILKLMRKMSRLLQQSFLMKMIFVFILYIVSKLEHSLIF